MIDLGLTAELTFRACLWLTGTLSISLFREIRICLRILFTKIIRQ